MRGVSLLIPVLAVAACAEPEPVFESTLLAKNASGAEVFLGVARGNPNVNGVFQIKSREGVVCAGIYLMESPQKGSAVAECDDGRRGEFTITSRGRFAEGTGTLGGEKFSVAVVDTRIVRTALAAMDSGLGADAGDK